MIPQTISTRYKLLKTEKPVGQSTAQKGIYWDKETKSRVFVKIDKNKNKLRGEFVRQELFYKYSLQLKDKDVIIPKPLEIVEINDFSAFIMEYVGAKSLEKTDVKTRVDVYEKVTKFLEDINTHTNIAKQKEFKVKSATQQLFTLPYFLIKNLILYPKEILIFLNAYVLIFKNAPFWVKLRFDWVCHGDINVTNLLTYKNKVVLVDFALSCKSHRLFDISRLLNSTWYKAGFHDELWDNTVGKLDMSPSKHTLIKSFVSFNLIQRLSQHYLKKGQEQFYLDRLQKMAKISMTKDHLKQLKSLLEKYGYPYHSQVKIDKFDRFGGILKDSGGKKYFVKAAIGKDSYKYKSLYLESQVTRYLSTQTKKINLSHNGYRLYVPSVAKIIDQDEIFCLITNYVDGKKLVNENSKTQANIILTTLTLVAKLSEKTRMSTLKPYLKNYTRKALLIFLPLRFIKATILSPFAFRGLLNASWKSLPLLLPHNYKCGLVHPDINVSNIVFNKNAIYLTDWEGAGWGITAYNTITPLCVDWKIQTLRDKLFAKLQDNGQNKITIPLLAYRTLMLFNQHAKRENEKRKRDLMLLKFLETA